MKTPTIRTSFKSAPAGLSRRRVVSTELEIRKILAPVDFSESSDNALDSADIFARHFGADLHLVHVFEPHHPFVDSTALPLIAPESQTGPRVRQRLQKLIRDRAIAIPQENVHVIKGSAFERICALASELNTDLIVISTRGNTGIKHLVLGSTAERVVRNSPCPVFIMPPARRSRTEQNHSEQSKSLVFNKILVPIDFSKCSLDGLAYAKKLAGHFGSKLILLHAVHLQYYMSSDEYGRYDFTQVMERVEACAREQMRELIHATEWDGVEFATSIEIGHAGQEICDRAFDRGVDLIVTSTHGHSGLKHVFLGSTAEYVVRHATCPVLVVPSHPRPISPNESSR